MANNIEKIIFQSKEEEKIPDPKNIIDRGKKLKNKKESSSENPPAR